MTSPARPPVRNTTTSTPGGEYYNYSGCGNTLNCNHPVVRDFIVDCLRYWVLVSGRFDRSKKSFCPGQLLVKLWSNLGFCRHLRA
jgi:hypothetical protein